MLKRDKRSLTVEEQRDCWHLWRQGLGFSDIARELGSKPAGPSQKSGQVTPLKI